MCKIDQIPSLEQFRIEPKENRIIHLVFDMPDRSMNVFSNQAIHELGEFADWLKQSDTKGVVICSGKTNAFCAGADLTELGVAYDMIVAAREQDRFDIAYNHFFPLSHAIRKMETAGVPIAVAVAGLALGGGCELALGGHYRVLTNDKSAAMGLPESLVGLFPGAGGTQRMPRLIGTREGLDVLLNGTRLSGQSAIDAGLAQEIVESGDEIKACEQWLLSTQAHCVQPWDRDEYEVPSRAEIETVTKDIRARTLADILGHFPAPLAILDCVEQGGSQSFDAAIRTEMSIFSYLIQRIEPRNMIQTMFLGKTAFDRAVRKGTVSDNMQAAISDLEGKIDDVVLACKELQFAGFKIADSQPIKPVQARVGKTMWLYNSKDKTAQTCLTSLAPILEEAKKMSASFTDMEHNMIDYALVSKGKFPAYLGGPITLMKFDQKGR